MLKPISNNHTHGIPRLGMLLLACALTAPAQSNQASVRGLVTDAQHASVPDAEVTAVNKDTGGRTATKTNTAGLYSFGNLPVGKYSLTVVHPGFHTYVRDEIVLSTGDVVGLDVTLEVGAVSESITVTEVATAIQSRTSDVNQLITSKSVEDLPLGDRQTLNVIKMMGAAVFASTGTSSTSSPNYSLAGGRSQTEMTWIDGGSAQNMRMGTPSLDEDPPVETIEEIKVISNSYAAEYGGSAGGVVIMTTKSGSNQFHGSLWEYVRNDKFDAPGFFAPVSNGQKLAPELRYNVFGGVLGGPIRRDKTFFFFGIDNSRRVEGSTNILTVPTALQKAGDFSQTLNAKGQLIPIYDPSTTKGSGAAATRLLFPGNIIPAAELDPVGLNVMKYYPLPNQPPANPAGSNNFSANSAIRTPHYNITSKVNQNFGSNDKLTGRFLYNHDDQHSISFYPDPGADPTQLALTWQAFYYGSWTHIVSPSQMNELRFTFETRVNDAGAVSLGGGYPDKIGIKGVSEATFPKFSPSGFSTIGSGQNRKQFPIQVFQWVDNYSWVRGKHSLKFGAEVRRSRNHDLNQNNGSGTFGFSTQATGLPGNTSTGNGLASMLTGFVTSFTMSINQVADRSSWYLAGFVQDDWSVSPRLTLNFGLRWETDTPMIDADNHMNGFDLTAINPVSGTPGVVKFMGVDGFRSTPYNTDWNNFGPRFGFAWKPFRSPTTVVRGGFGVSYSHPFDAGAPSSANLGFSVTLNLSTPDNGLTAPFYLRDGVPATATAAATSPLNDSYGAVKVGQAASTTVPFFDTNRRTGYSQQFNLTVQHQLRGGIMAEISGIGNLSRKLPGATITLNQILPQVLSASADTQAFRPYPQFSDVQLLYPTMGVSNYYAGMLRAERKFTRNLDLLATYTFSKFLSNTTDGGSTLGQTPSYSNYYNRRADYGPSGNDIRSRLTFSGIYELPFGTGRHWLAQSPLRHVAGGWRLANLTTVQSGPPFTVTTQTNNCNCFSAGSQRANVVGGSYTGAQTVAQWFNTAAFAQPATLHFGNAGVGILRGPGLVNFDFSVLRDFHPTERLRLQFRGEFLNAFNHTNLGLPNAALGGSGFATINTARSARQVQVGARMTF